MPTLWVRCVYGYGSEVADILDSTQPECINVETTANDYGWESDIVTAKYADDDAMAAAMDLISGHDIVLAVG